MFTSVSKMLSQINGGRADGTRDRRLGGYRRPDLLILDDFGLKPLRGHDQEDFYEVINERYERGSVLATSNRATASGGMRSPTILCWHRRRWIAWPTGRTWSGRDDYSPRADLTVGFADYSCTNGDLNRDTSTSVHCSNGWLAVTNRLSRSQSRPTTSNRSSAPTVVNRT